MSRRRSVRVKLGGRYWTIRWGTRKSSTWDADTSYERREIWLSEDLKGQRLVESIMHEMDHVLYPYLTEEVVEKANMEKAKVIMDLGLIQPDQGM